MLAASPKSTLPPTQWAMPGRPQQDGGVEDVGADDALRRQAEDRDQDDRDQGAAARRGEADHEAGGRAGDHGGDDVPAVEVHRVALRDHVAKEQRPDQRRDPDHEQGRSHHPQHHLVDLVLAVVVLQDLDQPDARDRHRHAADREPEGDPAVDGLVLQMAPAAGRLGDGAVEDVGADRGHRLDAEDEDQERGHQRAAAHAGHADQHADAEAEYDDDWIHCPGGAGVGVQPAGRPGTGSLCFGPFLTGLVRRAELNSVAVSARRPPHRVRDWTLAG